jgi:hypothetical protein
MIKYGCGKATTQIVPKGFDYKEVPARCGQTSIHGGMVLCDACESLERGDNVKILKTGERDYGNPEEYGYGENWHRTYTVKLPKGISRAMAYTATGAIFNTSCHCEHDCCGHVCGGVSEVTHSKRREWIVRTCYGHNV